MVPDLLSRPFSPSLAHQVHNSDDPEYVPPEKTLVALEEVSMNILTPSKLAEAQESCEDVKSHVAGNKPRGVKSEFVNLSGHRLYCEVSDPHNPRPLVPKHLRNLVVNLLHHQAHPSEKETKRRIAVDYYWPCLKNDVHGFVKTCHPCQVQAVGNSQSGCQSLRGSGQAFQHGSLGRGGAPPRVRAHALHSRRFLPYFKVAGMLPNEDSLRC